MAGKMRGREPVPVNTLGRELARLRLEHGVSRKFLGQAARRAERSRCRVTVLEALIDKRVRRFLEGAGVPLGTILAEGWRVVVPRREVAADGSQGRLPGI